MEFAERQIASKRLVLRESVARAEQGIPPNKAIPDRLSSATIRRQVEDGFDSRSRATEADVAFPAGATSAWVV